MPDVAGGQCRALGKRNAGDHGVARLDRTASTVARRHQGCRLLCRCLVKWQDAVFQIFNNYLTEGSQALISSLAHGHNGKSVLNF